MKITVEDFSTLSGEQIDEWRQLQQGAPELCQPLLCARVRRRGQRCRHDGRSRDGAGEWPNGRRASVSSARAGVGTNVGGQICDFQGIVGAPGQTIDTKSLLIGCGLDAYDFNHLPVSQSTLAAGAYMQFCFAVYRSFGGLRCVLRRAGSRWHERTQGDRTQAEKDRAGGGATSVRNERPEPMQRGEH